MFDQKPPASWGHLRAQTGCFGAGVKKFMLKILVYFSVRKWAAYGFGEFQRERTQWLSLSLLYVCHSELTEFFEELAEFAAELSKFSLPKQYSRNSILPVSYLSLTKVAAL